MAVLKIKVPKVPKTAFNKYRPASELLKAQLEHLEAAAGKYKGESSPLRRAVKALTEDDVATRIEALTRRLHLPTDEQPAATTVASPILEPLARARASIRQRIAEKKSALRKGGQKARKKG